MTEYKEAPKGCEFLLREVATQPILTPEEFTEDQKMFSASAKEFMTREVLPLAEKLEKGDHNLMADVLRKAGGQGLLMLDIPEVYGGLGVDKTTSMLVTEELSRYASFATSHGAHAGIGTLPLLFFGNTEQKAEILPKLATGEWLAAYALTEPGSGSDALAAKTKAVLSEDGEHYVLNGTKMWITNAGFADLFTVFCQVDGDKFTAFLVEADRDGVSTGLEEHKMGLKGSSTRLLILENVKIPKKNLLGEIGKGHKIAFNILNIGRFKLGVGVLGGCKRLLELGVGYANERVAFGQPISNFGAIQLKLGETLSQIYALESACYRVAGYMDNSLDNLDTEDPDYAKKTMKAIEEYAIEDSIIKVVSADIGQYIAYEAVQIHGGMGYSSEYEVERGYRDMRINSIFEGTNEINRMLIPGMILKRTMKGELNLFEVIQQVEATIQAGAPSIPDSEGIAYDAFLVEQAKKIALYSANQAIQKYMMALKDEQQVLLNLADMLIHVYTMDSTVARTTQLIKAQGAEAVQAQRDATRLYVSQSFSKVATWARELVCNISEGDAQDAHIKALDTLTVTPRVPTIALRKNLAKLVIEREKYPFA